ncbi:MAG: BACON domain-containing protein [Bacteroidales bacterium]|nr:BACON domain-containing protein [Bacteroidales bacterium]
MRARNLFFALAALSIFAACNPKEDTPKVQGTLTVSGAKDNAITVAGAGKTVKLTVKSNLSWTASCDADWIEIDPVSVENTDNKVVSTKVSVVVKKNTDKERSAEIKLGAEGVDPVVITVKQSAEVAEESVLCVWDMDKFVPFENPSISTDFYAAEISFVVHANVDWTATCPSWITLDPTSNKYDGQTQNVTVKAVVAVNDEEGAREGEIKFVGEGVADLVIPVKQAKAARVKLALKETEHPYTDVDFEVVPDEGITWTAKNFDDDEIAYLAENKLTPADFLIYQLNYFLQKGYTVDQVTAGLLTSGNGTENVEGLKGETHYQFTAIGAVYDEDYKQFIPTTLPADLEYTTAKAPVAEAAYEALAGTYEMKVVDSKSNERTLQMIVAPLYVNEAYTFHFPNNDFSPVDGTFVDKFVMVYDGANKALIVPNGQVGSEGFTWGFQDADGNTIDGGILFYAEVGETSKEDGTEAAAPKNLVYNWTDDYNTLNLATDLGGKNLHWYALVANLNSENKLQIFGRYKGYTFAGSTSLIKTPAAASTKSVKKVDLMHPEFPVKDGGSYLLK